MSRIFTAAVAVLVLALCVVQLAEAAPDVGRGAFLRQRADNVKALVDQVGKDSLVAQRYRKHFGVTVEALQAYFRDNLSLITLKKPTRTDIYFIGKDGSIIKGSRLLPAGNRVFATKSGQLILEWRCGNPLVKTLPQQTVKKPVPTGQAQTPVTQPAQVTQPTAAEPTQVAAVETPVPTTAVAAEPPIEIGTIPVQPVTVTPVTPIEVATNAVVPPVTPVVTPPVVTATVPAVSAPVPVVTSGGGFPWVLPVLIGGGALLGGGGGGGGLPPPGPKVPEPGSLMIMVGGLSAVAAGYRIRRSR